MFSFEPEPITDKNLFLLIDSWLKEGMKDGRRFYFRGEKALANGTIDYPLQPSLVRPTILTTLKNTWGKTELNPHDLEERVLKRFKRYTAHLIEKDGAFVGRTLKDLEILCLGQHYGLPTMLLDWTLNPFVALYFALTADDTGDVAECESRFWAFMLPEGNKREKLTVHLEENTKEEDIKTIISDAKDHDQPVIVVPLVFTQRIATQSGRFIYCPHARDSNFDLATSLKSTSIWKDCLRCYKIPKSKKVRQDLLRKIEFTGFHAGLIYPDLSGWARYLRLGNK